MCCSVNNVSCYALCCITGVVLVTVSIITLLVVGILGSENIIIMPPTGPDWMIGISCALIAGMIGGVVKFCCYGKR